MKQPYRTIIIVSIVSAVLVFTIVVVGVGIKIWCIGHKQAGWEHEGPDLIMLDSLQTGANRIQFYIDYGPDSAVLGFVVKDQTGHPRYFPIYCSTYRGLPPVELKVLLSEAEEEMWVLSSWQGHEVLAYYRLGSDRCTTCYGENTASDTPTPQSFGGGGSKGFPDMDRAHVKSVLTIKYPQP